MNKTEQMCYNIEVDKSITRKAAMVLGNNTEARENLGISGSFS